MYPCCCPGHLENINNHLRSQMPSHWAVPNWVTLQSAAQNHTRGPASSAPPTDTHHSPGSPVRRCVASGNNCSAFSPIPHLLAFFIDLERHVASICLWITTICQSVKHLFCALLSEVSAKQNTGYAVLVKLVFWSKLWDNFNNVKETSILLSPKVESPLITKPIYWNDYFHWIVFCCSQRDLETQESFMSHSNTQVWALLACFRFWRNWDSRGLNEWFLN